MFSTADHAQQAKTFENVASALTATGKFPLCFPFCLFLGLSSPSKTYVIGKQGRHRSSTKGQMLCVFQKDMFSKRNVGQWSSSWGGSRAGSARAEPERRLVSKFSLLADQYFEMCIPALLCCVVVVVGNQLLSILACCLSQL